MARRSFSRSRSRASYRRTARRVVRRPGVRRAVSRQRSSRTNTVRLIVESAPPSIGRDLPINLMQAPPERKAKL